MAKVEVFMFQRYDITSDQNVRSKRYATLDAIEEVCAEPIMSTREEADESELGAEIEGMTARGWQPARSANFQTEVKS